MVITVHDAVFKNSVNDDITFVLVRACLIFAF